MPSKSDHMRPQILQNLDRLAFSAIFYVERTDAILPGIRRYGSPPIPTSPRIRNSRAGQGLRPVRLLLTGILIFPVPAVYGSRT